jgi:hypothetical protein
MLTDIKYILELTDIEAEVLVKVLNNVAGDPTFSNRYHTDSICNALVRAGVTENPLQGVRIGRLDFGSGE